MAILYVEDGGFRFPYPKWTDTSTPQNLMYLESQLSRYLHDHVTASEVLYWENMGSRFMEARSRENLEANMKIVEVQLDKFLHSHTIDAGNRPATQTALDPEIDLTTNIPGTAHGVSDGEYFWVDGGNHTTVPSTINPHIGNNHIRITINSLPSQPGVFVADPEWQAVNRPVAGRAVEGDIISGSVWAVSSTITKPFFIAVQWLNVGFFTLDDIQLEVGTMSSSYQKFERPPITAPVDTKYFAIYMYAAPGTGFDIGDIYDLDTYVVNHRAADPNTLYTVDEGFRFPYGWKTDGDIASNRRFLETQISKFLHEHVEEA